MATTDTTITDPLVTEAYPDRPNYALGVMLGADDFTDEQTYHRGRLARALQVVGGAGTIAGLKVTYVPKTSTQIEELQVASGIALDGRGRIIEIAAARCIDLQRWWDNAAAPPDTELTAAFKTDHVVADVFVRFVACGRARQPAFASGPFDALDATTYARIRDGAELKLVTRSETTLPTLVDPWASITGATAADRLAKAKAAVLDAWDTISSQPEKALVPGTLDASLDWLLLARISLPAAQASAGALPTRTATAPTVDNTVRPVVLVPAALAHIVGP
ncbi:MAG TPA: hypothetical protein VGM88_15165 [Kofleriaceae bacterium]|jgi:hypothetical protein